LQLPAVVTGGLIADRPAPWKRLPIIIPQIAENKSVAKPSVTAGGILSGAALLFPGHKLCIPRKSPMRMVYMD